MIFCLLSKLRTSLIYNTQFLKLEQWSFPSKWNWCENNWQGRRGIKVVGSLLLVCWVTTDFWTKLIIKTERFVTSCYRHALIVVGLFYVFSAEGDNAPAALPDGDAEPNLLCKVCFSEEMNVVLMPCRHLAVCERCSGRVSSCPICHSHVESSFRASFGWNRHAGCYCVRWLIQAVLLRSSEAEEPFSS